jgi:hypothetical protein
MTVRVVLLEPQGTREYNVPEYFQAMVGTEFLGDAVDTLEAIVTGRAPDRTQALVGAFALNRLSLESEANTGLSSRGATRSGECCHGAVSHRRWGPLTDKSHCADVPG